MEIIQERLDREFDLDLHYDGSFRGLQNAHGRWGDAGTAQPGGFPDPVKIAYIEEPWVKATIMVPDEFWGQF